MHSILHTKHMEFEVFYDYDIFKLLNEIFSLYLEFKTIYTEFHQPFLLKFIFYQPFWKFGCLLMLRSFRVDFFSFRICHCECYISPTRKFLSQVYEEDGILLLHTLYTQEEIFPLILSIHHTCLGGCDPCGGQPSCAAFHFLILPCRARSFQIQRKKFHIKAQKFHNHDTLYHTCYFKLQHKLMAFFSIIAEY